MLVANGVIVDHFRKIGYREPSQVNNIILCFRVAANVIAAKQYGDDLISLIAVAPVVYFS
jgi:hypothetical protein